MLKLWEIMWNSEEPAALLPPHGVNPKYSIILLKYGTADALQNNTDVPAVYFTVNLFTELK